MGNTAIAVPYDAHGKARFDVRKLGGQAGTAVDATIDRIRAGIKALPAKTPWEVYFPDDPQPWFLRDPAVFGWDYGTICGQSRNGTVVSAASGTNGPCLLLGVQETPPAGASGSGPFTSDHWYDLNGHVDRFCFPGSTSAAGVAYGLWTKGDASVTSWCNPLTFPGQSGYMGLSCLTVAFAIDFNGSAPVSCDIAGLGDLAGPFGPQPWLCLLQNAGANIGVRFRTSEQSWLGLRQFTFPVKPGLTGVIKFVFQINLAAGTVQGWSSQANGGYPQQVACSAVTATDALNTSAPWAPGLRFADGLDRFPFNLGAVNRFGSGNSGYGILGNLRILGFSMAGAQYPLSVTGYTPYTTTPLYQDVGVGTPLKNATGSTTLTDNDLLQGTYAPQLISYLCLNAGAAGGIPVGPNNPRFAARFVRFGSGQLSSYLTSSNGTFVGVWVPAGRQFNGNADTNQTTVRDMTVECYNAGFQAANFYGTAISHGSTLEITFKDMNIYGGRQGLSPIKFGSNWDHRMENCVVQGYGASVFASWSILDIRNCTFNAGRQAVLTEGTELTMEGKNFVNGFGGGIYPVGQGDSVVRCLNDTYGGQYTIKGLCIDCEAIPAGPDNAIVRIEKHGIGSTRATVEDNNCLSNMGNDCAGIWLEDNTGNNNRAAILARNNNFAGPSSSGAVRVDSLNWQGVAQANTGTVDPISSGDPSGESRVRSVHEEFDIAPGARHGMGGWVRGGSRVHLREVPGLPRELACIQTGSYNKATPRPRWQSSGGINQQTGSELGAFNLVQDYVAYSTGGAVTLPASMAGVGCLDTTAKNSLLALWLNGTARTAPTSLLFLPNINYILQSPGGIAAGSGTISNAGGYAAGATSINMLAAPYGLQPNQQVTFTGGGGLETVLTSSSYVANANPILLAGSGLANAHPTGVTGGVTWNTAGIVPLTAFGAAAARKVTNAGAIVWYGFGPVATQQRLGFCLTDQAGSTLVNFNGEVPMVLGSGVVWTIAAGQLTIGDAFMANGAAGSNALGVFDEATGGLSNYAWHKSLDLLFRGVAVTPPSALYLGLSTAPANAAGTVTEPVGNGYARASVGLTNMGRTPFTPNFHYANRTAIAFPAPTGSWGTAASCFFADAATGGNVLAPINLAARLTPTAGVAPSFAPGALCFAI